MSDFWSIMVRKDDFILDTIDLFFILKAKISLKYNKILASNKLLKIEHEKDVFVILNGPSVNKQDLSKLIGKDVIFVNRGFKHPLFKHLKPKFYFFVDSKILHGEWPLTWLDEIHQMSPDTIFVMPAHWANLEFLRPYILKGYNFYWLPSDRKCNCIGVGGACLSFCAKIGYKTIYFTGFEATGLAHEMINTASSHFYGINEENLIKTTKDYERDLYMMSRHLHDLNRFAQNMNSKNIKIYNLTEGGLLDMFKRSSYKSIIK